MMLYIQVLLDSLLLGLLYGCLTIGFSLVWGVLNIINILHGTMIIMGGYAAIIFYDSFGIPPWYSMILIGMIFFVIGFILQKVIINRVLAASVLITLTMTFGLDLIFNNTLLNFFSSNYVSLKLQPSLGSTSFGPFSLPNVRIVIAVLAVVLALLVHFFLSKTQTGRAINAVRLNKVAAQLMGINISKTYAIAFGLSVAAAACAGSLLVMAFPISPIVSMNYLAKAFIICVLGGLGSISGALAGGIMIALVENFGTLAVGPQYGLTLSFILLIIFLIFRPRGLFGRVGYDI